MTEPILERQVECADSRCMKQSCISSKSIAIRKLCKSGKRGRNDYDYIALWIEHTAWEVDVRRVQQEGRREDEMWEEQRDVETG